MPRTSCLPACLLLLSLPLAASAEGVAYRGAGFGLSHLADDPEQTRVEGYGVSDLHFTSRLGFQGEAGLQHIATHDDDQTAAWIALHPYLRAGGGVALGGYLKGRAGDESAASGGVEIAWQNASGLTAEAFFGQTWGDELDDDGHATNRGARLGYTFASDLYATLYFNKDTSNESGRRDHDYYDYGVQMELPLGAMAATRLTAGLGRVRFDADDRAETRLGLGLTHQYGGGQERPTFSRQRSVLTTLAGF